MTTNYSAEYEFLLQLRRPVRQIVLDGYRRVAVESKADGTDVTAADRNSELAIRAALRERFPGDAILAEEFGGDSEVRDGRCWVIDPIDGTTWYGLGVPFFSSLIALLVDGEPVCGMADFPAMDETYIAARGLGAWTQRGLGGPERIAVRAPCALGEAFGSASGIHDSEWAPRGGEAKLTLGQLARATRRFRFCGDALQHMLVARGALDLAVDQRMAAWDSAALIPIIEEAGGVVSDLGGRRDGVVFAGSLVTASHPELLAQTLEHLRL